MHTMFRSRDLDDVRHAAGVPLSALPRVILPRRLPSFAFALALASLVPLSARAQEQQTHPGEDARPLSVAQAAGKSGAPATPPATAPADQTQPTVVRQRERKIVKPGETTVLNEKVMRKDGGVKGTGFALFLGVDAGYGFETMKDASLGPAKKGLHLGGKILGSLYPKDWVFDFGLGWLYSGLSGPESTPSGTRNITVITQVPYLSLAGRYRLSENWQAGVIVDTAYGTDLSFSSTTSNNGPVVFAGLQAMYGVPEKTFDLRYGAQIESDLNLSGKKLVVGLLTIQLGLPVFKPDTVIRESRVSTVRERVQREEVEKIIPRVIVKEVVKYRFDNVQIPFEPARAELSPDTQSFLLELADVLKGVSSSWKELVVEGHVDNQGTPELSHELSTRRAFAVEAALVAGGLPQERLKHLGYGATRPLDPLLDSQAVQAQNQRIELSFSGVTDIRALNEAINHLRLVRSRPETCEDSGRCR